MSDTFRRDRGAVIALALVLVSVILVVWISNWTVGPQEASKPIANRYITTQDTIAQWMMAGLGILGTFVSLWAVTLVRDTLAVNTRATEAAESAVAVAREIGHAQIRAYLSVKVGFIDEPRNGKVSIYTRIFNTGETPAMGLAIENKIAVTNRPLSAGDELPPFEPMTPHESVLAKGEQTDTVVTLDVPDDFFAKVASGEMVPYAYGRIKYYDVLRSDVRITHFHLRCRYFPEMKGFLFVADGPGIIME